MRLIPAQQLGEHNGAHESGHDCPGQLRGARPGEGGAWGTGFGAYNKEGHIKVWKIFNKHPPQKWINRYNASRNIKPNSYKHHLNVGQELLILHLGLVSLSQQMEPRITYYRISIPYHIIIICYHRTGIDHHGSSITYHRISVDHYRINTTCYRICITYHMISITYHVISITFHRISITCHGISITHHRLSVDHHGISITWHGISSTHHRLSVDHHRNNITYYRICITYRIISIAHHRIWWHCSIREALLRRHWGNWLGLWCHVRGTTGEITRWGTRRRAGTWTCWLWRRRSFTVS